jgi:peptidoglycan/LPS O-acetylase OafA/YrhL
LRGIPVAFGTALWIVVALQSDVHQRLLTSVVPQWLGRIAYSLYLTHALVIVALVYTLGDVIGAPAAIVVSPLFALAFAEMFYRLVERPAIDAGHRIRLMTAPLTAASYPHRNSEPTSARPAAARTPETV